MSIKESSIGSWIKKKKYIERIYRDLPNKTKIKIDSTVEMKLFQMKNMLEPEIRPGNGYEKVIKRERERLFIEEVALKFNQENTINIEPYKENSDGNHPGMIFIPTSNAVIGVKNGFASREETEKVMFVSGFWIDIFPITNEQYHQLFHLHTPNPNYSDGNMPVVNVTWFDAHKFSSALGKRLPTQEEWEKAARGPYNWIYSFGDKFNDSDANIWPAKGPKEVASYNPNPWGLYQMSGNIWEWTSNIYCHEIDQYRRIYYNLVRGGSWRHCSWGARTTISLCLDLGHRSENVGFRCVCSF